MKHTIQYINNKNYFLIRTFGELSGKGSVAIFRDLLMMKEWHKGALTLVDHRNASVNSLTVEEIEHFSTYLTRKKAIFGHGKMAIIMSPLEAMSKYAMWKIGIESDVFFLIEVFNDITEAEEWFSQETLD